MTTTDQEYKIGLILVKNNNVFLTINSKDIAEYPCLSSIDITEKNKMQTICKNNNIDSNVKLLKNIYIDEFNEKGKVSHRYYVGVFDEDIEQDNRWINIDNVYNMKNFFQRRKDYLLRATEALKRSMDVDFVTISDWTEIQNQKKDIPLSKQKYIPRPSNNNYSSNYNNYSNNNNRQYNTNSENKKKDVALNFKDMDEWPTL